MPFEISAATDMAEVRALFVEYVEWLDVDLAFQGFPEELAGLPGAYAPPAGRLLVARAQGPAAGCVALKPRGPGTAEMKRLWVRPAFRGQGLGRALAEAAIAGAREIGYRRLVLDSLPKLAPAIAMYRRMGFTDTAPYYEGALPGMTFLEMILPPPG